MVLHPNLHPMATWKNTQNGKGETFTHPNQQFFWFRAIFKVIFLSFFFFYQHVKSTFGRKDVCLRDVFQPSGLSKSKPRFLEGSDLELFAYQQPLIIILHVKFHQGSLIEKQWGVCCRVFSSGGMSNEVQQCIFIHAIHFLDFFWGTHLEFVFLEVKAFFCNE